MTTTMLYMTATLCLTIGIVGVLFGLFRAKWAMMAWLSGMALNLLALAIDVTEALIPESTTSTWRIGRYAVAAAILAAILATAGRKVLDATARRRLATPDHAAGKLPKDDPAGMALAWAPEMAADVDVAMERIARLKSVADRASDQEDANVLVMIERRIPSIMELYRRTSEASTPEERPAITRMALESIIDIGRMAEDARRRIAAGLRDGLDAESRYVRTRAENAGALHAD